MQIKHLDAAFSVCKLASVPEANFMHPYTFFAQTDDEISLVCQTQYVPAAATEVEHGWDAFKICGVLDFSMVGVIAKLSGLLAEKQIPVFVISTYNTDYVLVKHECAKDAAQALTDGGYQITRSMGAGRLG